MFFSCKQIAPVPVRAETGMRCGCASAQFRGCPCNCKRIARCMGSKDRPLEPIREG